MKKEAKLKRLRSHAKTKNYSVDEELTSRLQNAYSDEKINLRVPSELKAELVAAAKKKNIPYQRYIKMILIDAIQKDKAS